MKPFPGVVVSLPDVYLFAFNSSAIGAEGRAKLKELAAYLARPELLSRRVSIEGHTDSIGTDAVNQSLSERRAESVRRELLTGGVPETASSRAASASRSRSLPTRRLMAPTIPRGVRATAAWRS